MGKRLYRVRPQNGRAALQHAFREAGDVAGGSKEAGMSGDAAQHKSVLVVHLALNQPPAKLAVIFGGRDLWPPLLRRVEAGASHTEGREDLLAGKKIKREPGPLCQHLS